MSLDFVIAGAYRCGTTTLRKWIAQHPSIFMPELAEPSYFAFDDGAYPEHMLKGTNDPFRRKRITNRIEYEQLFDGAPDGSVQGECSPEYLRAPGSAARLHAHSPNCRIVVTLRNPVDRLISDWAMCRRDGAEQLDFADAMAAIPTRRERGEFGGHYEATSRYSTGLRELRDTFPEEQLLVLIQERWSASSVECARQLATLLDVDASQFPSKIASENTSGIPHGRVSAALWSLRRVAAPVLADRVPAAIQQAGNRWLAKGLESPHLPEHRSLAHGLVGDEIDAVRALLDDDLPEWA